MDKRFAAPPAMPIVQLLAGRGGLVVVDRAPAANKP